MILSDSSFERSQRGEHYALYFEMKNTSIKYVPINGKHRAMA